MGKLIRLTGVNFVGAPKLKQFDDIETLGSLFLLDFSDMPSLPAVNAEVPNKLASLTQSLTGQSLGLQGLVNKRSGNSADWLVERTSKGGIHGIIKHGTGTTTQNAFVVFAPLAARNYMLANPNNNYYVSLWSKVTKNALSSPAPQSPMHFCPDSAGATNGFFNSATGIFATQGGNRINETRVPLSSDLDIAVPANRFASAQYSGIVNIGSALTSSHNIQMVLGAHGPWGSFNTDKAPSKIIYRAYIEDLTVSGRTFAEVAAIDQAIFNKEFSEGGKFYNDTYTNPNSL